MVCCHCNRNRLLLTRDAVTVCILLMYKFLVAHPYFACSVMLSYQCDEGNATVCLSQWDPSLILDYIFDVFFIADIYMHCCKFAYADFEIDHSVIVSDRRLLMSRYLRSKRAIVAVIAVLPWDVLSMWCGGIILLRYYFLFAFALCIL